MKRRLLMVWLIVAASTLIGCGPPWHVVRQTTPDPFIGQKQFAVAPVEYPGLRIGRKDEGEYLSGKDAKQQASFADDKAGLNEKFAAALMAKAREAGLEVAPATGPASAPFVIHAAVPFIEPGFYGGVVSQPSRVEMVVTITSPDGKVLDEIHIGHSTSPSSGVAIGGVSIPSHPASGDRLRKDGEGLGEIVAKYLKLRAGLGG